MKNKKLVVSCIIGSIIAIGFIFACSKPNDAKTINQVKESTLSEQGAQSSSRRASSGTDIYYSTDDEGNYYKMILTWDASGNVDINRAQVTSGYPTNVQNAAVLESGISYSIIDDKAVIAPPEGKKYYKISFTPGGSISEVVNGGGIKVYCQATCNDLDGICTLSEVPRSDGSILITCPGNCKCKIVSSGCPGGAWDGCVAPITPGVFILEANSINVIN